MIKYKGHHEMRREIEVGNKIAKKIEKILKEKEMMLKEIENKVDNKNTKKIENIG